MARRRNIGQALAGGSMRGVIDLLIKQHIEEKSRVRQNADLEARQRGLSRQGFEQTLVEKLLANPQIATRLSTSGLKNLGGLDTTQMPMDAFLPTGGEVAKPLLDKVTGATTQAALPTEAELGAGFNFGGGRGTNDIEMLMTARAMKEQELQRLVEQSAAGESRFDPTIGAKVATRPGLGTVQLDPTGTQAGQIEADKLRVTGPVTAENAGLSAGAQARAVLAPDIIQGEARRSGSLAAAAEAARIRTQHANRGLLAEVAEELAQARSSGKAASEGTSAIVMKLGDDMIKMSEQLNTKEWGPAAIGQGLRDRFEGLIQTNPVAKKLKDDRVGYTPLFARMFGHTGVLTQQDVDSVRSVLPDSGLTVEVSNNRNATFRAVIQAGRTIGDTLGAIDPNLPPEAQSALFRERLEAAKSAAQGGELVFEVGADGVMRAVVR